MTQAEDSTTDSGAAGERRATVLLVVDDPASRHALEKSLGRAQRFELVCVSTGAAAMEELDTRVIDVVVVDVDQHEVDGFEILHEIERRSHSRQLPVLFLAADERVATKLEAFRSGVADYITKPYAIAEVVARIVATLGARPAFSRARVRRGCNLAGDFTGMAFSDLVHLLHIGQRNGLLSVLTPRGTGELTFFGGKVYHAEFGNLEGEEAFYRFMIEAHGQFEFESREMDPNRLRNTIAVSPTALLMEGARRADSWRQSGEPDDAPAAAEREDGGVEAVALHDAIVPTEALDAAATTLVTDVESRPELKLHVRDRLRGWTEGNRSARVPILLVTDTPGAAAGLLRNAKPIDVAQIESALSVDQKVLGAVWRDRDDVEVDVLVFDQEFPAFVLNELAVRPAALVIAPREGHWATLPLNAILELEAMIAYLTPAAIVTVGDDSVRDGISSLVERAGVTTALRALERSAEEPVAPIGDWLAAAIEAWAAPAPESETEPEMEAGSAADSGAESPEGVAVESDSEVGAPEPAPSAES